jgi:group I intron endonuclease
MIQKRIIYRLWHDRSVAGRIGYIGKDSRYPKRLNLIRRTREKGCPKLYRAFKKYPLKFWYKEILASGFRSENGLNKAEMFWIAKFNSKNKGYNCTDGGDGRSGSSPSTETRKKLRDWNVGRWVGKKNGFYGQKHSIETRKHWSKIRKGRKLSPETIRKLTESSTGRKASVETRAKIGRAHKGKIVSKETRLKIGVANKGHKAWNKGKSWDVAMRKKISQSTSKAIKLWWAKRKESAKQQQLYK